MIAVFGFDEFGEKVCDALKRDFFVVVFNEEEEQLAKEKNYKVVKLRDINNNELKKLDHFDIALAVLKEEDKNLFLILSLREVFEDVKIVAKVTSKENEYKYRLAGVNKIINPYEITSNRIMTILKKPLTLKVIEAIIFEDNALSFAEIVVPEDSFLDKRYMKDIFKELSANYNILVVAIVDKERGERVEFVTKGINHKIDAGDILIVVGDRDEIERFKFDLELIKIKREDNAS